MIKAEDIFKKIGFILNDLQDQHDYLSHHPEKINLAEFHLFQANADFLSEHAKIYIKLKAAEEQETVPAEKPAASAPPVEIEVSGEPTDTFEEEPLADPTEQRPLDIAEIEEEASRIDLPQQEAGLPTDTEEETGLPAFEFVLKDEDLKDTFDFEEKPVEAIFDRKLTPEEEAVLASKKIAQAEEIHPETTEDEVGPEPFLMQPAEEVLDEAQEPTHENTVEDEILAAPGNLPSQAVPAAETRPTLNELLARKTGSNVPAKGEASVSDLKQAINLNDKLLYIKDLFNGYNLAYAEAIDLLNKQPDFTSADNFLQITYASKNNWAEKQATVDKFYELLNRRFPAR